MPVQPRMRPSKCCASGVQSVPGAAGNLEQGPLRIDASIVFCNAVEVEIKIREHIAFV